jgi:exocyst complex component 4
VLKYIQRDWDFMTDEKCVPVEVALKLMDDSSLGLAKRQGQFKDIHQQLQNALRAIVNEHHQGFNSSIGTFHSIQAAIHSSQTRLRTLRDSLVTAKGSLSTTKPELKGLASRSQDFDDMLKVLSSIEHLQAIPEKLEARISEKRFLSAVELLQDGLKTVRNSEMDGIGALSDLRVYLSNQEHSLTDIMIEELHNHLYLKSPYCENRWKQYAPNSMKISVTNGQTAPVTGRQLYQFLDKLDTSKVMQDDPARNPEADSFFYIQLIIESLNSLGRLDTVVESITQRLPVELFKVVEKSTNEADQRHPTSLRGKKGGLDALDGNNNARSIVLNDLLGSLFARFEAIAEGHRVVHEIISGILKREGMRSSSALTGGFRELWKLYQSEIRSILHDYLAADGNLGYRSGEGGNRPGSVFSKTQRDKNKQIFKLNDMDSKSSDMNTERNDLEAILKSSVPGLVSDSKRPSLLHQNASNGVTDGSATGHKLLVEPSVFNMGILLPPSLTFLNRLKEVVPPTSDIVLSTLTSFLDDFLVNVFLPQLEETLADLCAQTFIESDAFHQDPHWAQHSKKPIFKGTSKFFRLITAFCRMLDALPHDQAFSHLIISQIMTYYERCHEWYKALVARTKPHPASGRLMRMAAALMEENGELKETVTTLSQVGESDGAERARLLGNEIDLLIKGVQNMSIDEPDIIIDRRSITALCMLHTSMKWLAAKTAQMRHISAEAVDSTRRESRQGASRRWTLVANARGPADAEKVYLPLNEETAAQFDAAVGLYRQLAIAASRMLHVEIRCHVLHYIEKAMKRTFLLDSEVHEPDPEVVALNADLVMFDEVLGTCLQDPVRRCVSFITPGLELAYADKALHSFIITGISTLLDVLLLTSASSIPAMNAHGCARLQLNILVLQQNLKNIEPDASLSKSATYYDLFTLGSEQIVKRAKEQGKSMGFANGQVTVLLKLVYSEALRSERREVSVAAERGLAQDELLLSEYLW